MTMCRHAIGDPSVASILVALALVAAVSCRQDQRRDDVSPAPATANASAESTGGTKAGPTRTATPTATASAAPTNGTKAAPPRTATPSPTPTTAPNVTPPGASADRVTRASSPGPSTPSVTPSPGVPTATIGGVELEVEVVATPARRTRGLSGRESLPSMTGMLFVFESGSASAFWMRDMRFALDFVWIGDRCAVVDTTLNVPPPLPGTPDSSLPTYASASPAAYTLEINAGEVERLGIRVGDRMRFSGFPPGVSGADC